MCRQILGSSFLPGWRTCPVSPCVGFWPPEKHPPASQSQRCPARSTEHRKSLSGMSHHWGHTHTHTKRLRLHIVIIPMNPFNYTFFRWQWAAAYNGVKLLKVTWLLTCCITTAEIISCSDLFFSFWFHFQVPLTPVSSSINIYCHSHSAKTFSIPKLAF